MGASAESVAKWGWQGQGWGGGVAVLGSYPNLLSLATVTLLNMSPRIYSTKSCTQVKLLSASVLCIQG